MLHLKVVMREANRIDRASSTPAAISFRVLSSPLGKLQTQVALVVVHAIMPNLGCGDTE